MIMGKHIPIHQTHHPFPNVWERGFFVTSTKHMILCHVASLFLSDFFKLFVGASFPSPPPSIRLLIMLLLWTFLSSSELDIVKVLFVFGLCL